MEWRKFSEKILSGSLPSPAEALAVLQSSDDDLLAVLDAAFAVRRRYFRRDVSLHVIRNAKSGSCSENCAFCSQSAVSKSGIDKYRLQSADEIVAGAREAHKLSAIRYCIVTSGRGPTEKELETMCEAARRIKREIPIRICTSLGILTEAQAKRLKEAGVDRYNHNLESSERFYSSFCTTHSYEDRARTGRIVKAAGLELCSGGLIGMGETLQDRVDMAFALRELDADSIPVNFLEPRPGTPLENIPRLSPADCLRALALFRFVNPEREIRIAGGRETCIGSMQALALYPADSMFTIGYLTYAGQGFEADMKMVAQAGFRVSEILE